MVDRIVPDREPSRPAADDWVVPPEGFSLSDLEKDDPLDPDYVAPPTPKTPAELAAEAAAAEAAAVAAKADAKAEKEKRAAEKRLTFRAWLWVQHRDYSEFAPLARLVLGGGPEGVWLGKFLKPDFVRGEVEMFYASGRAGITETHVDLARRAPERFAEDALLVGKMVLDRAAEERITRRDIWAAISASARTVLAAQTSDGTDLPITQVYDRFPADEGFVGPELDLEAEDRLHGLADEPLADDQTPALPGAEADTSSPSASLSPLPSSSASSPTTLADKPLPGPVMRHAGNADKGLYARGLAAGLVPMVVCTFKGKTGNSCNRLSVGGTSRCDIHGGVLLDPEEARAAVRASSQRLLLAAEAAVDTVVDLMQNSVNDVVRLKAAEIILDRANITADHAAASTSSAASSPADELRARMARLVTTPAEVDGHSETRTLTPHSPDGGLDSLEVHGGPTPPPLPTGRGPNGRGTYTADTLPPNPEGFPEPPAIPTGTSDGAVSVLAEAVRRDRLDLPAAERERIARGIELRALCAKEIFPRARSLVAAQLKAEGIEEIEPPLLAAREAVARMDLEQKWWANRGLQPFDGVIPPPDKELIARLLQEEREREEAALLPSETISVYDITTGMGVSTDD